MMARLSARHRGAQVEHSYPSALIFGLPRARSFETSIRSLTLVFPSCACTGACTGASMCGEDLHRRAQQKSQLLAKQRKERKQGKKHF